MFSKACEYGIKATIFIAHQSMVGQRVSLKAIAKEIDSPEAFTAKILQALSRNKIVESIKGPKGGFEISSGKIEKISLNSIVDAIDGDKIYKGCALGMQDCNAKKPCPVHHKFVSVRDELQLMLEKTTLHELAFSIDEGHTYLKQ